MVGLMTYKASKEGEALDHPPQQGPENQRGAMGCPCPNSGSNTSQKRRGLGSPTLLDTINKVYHTPKINKS